MSETPEAPEATTETETEPHKRLTLAEWEQVVVLWESGSVTLQVLEDRFGISKASLSDGLKKRKAVKGCRAKEFAKQTEEQLKTDAQRRGEKIAQMRNQYHVFGDYIMQATIKELQEVRKKDRDHRTREDNARIFTWLKYSAEIFAICRDQKYHLFDLYEQEHEDGELPDIGVASYTPEDIAAIQDRQNIPLFEDDDDVLEEARKNLEEMGAEE